MAVRGAVAVTLIAILAVAAGPGSANAQSCTPPASLTCTVGGFVTCGVSTYYPSGTALSALPTPLSAVGSPMGQQLKCYTEGSVVVPTSELTLGSALLCPTATGAPAAVRVCKCGTCTAVNIPAVGFCTAEQTPRISCTNKNVSCVPGQPLTPEAFGCSSTPAGAQLYVDTRPAVQCSSTKVHIVSGTSRLGCYSVTNQGVFTYGDEGTIPQNPCGDCELNGGVCFQGCCLGSGQLKVTLTWDNNSDLDLELVNTNCITNAAFPNGSPFCASSLAPIGPLSPSMDFTAPPTASTCNDATAPKSCQDLNVENIYIKWLTGQKLFTVNVKGKRLCGPTKYTLSMQIRAKSFVVTGTLGSTFPNQPNAMHVLFDN